MIAACATRPLDDSSGISRIERQLACPAPPSRLIQPLAPPEFADAMAWPQWADALMGWGAEEARRRADLARWIKRHCAGTASDTAPKASSDGTE